jgi:hypothetical protein
MLSIDRISYLYARARVLSPSLSATHTRTHTHTPDRTYKKAGASAAAVRANVVPFLNKSSLYIYMLTLHSKYTRAIVNILGL